MRTAAPITRRLGAALAAPLLALGLAACGNTVSTSSFKGEQHAVAQKVADLQSHATKSEYDKICGQDIAAALRERLGKKSACEKAFKRQLGQTDNLELSVESVNVAADKKSATAQVKATRKGKKGSPSRLSLVKEGGGWRIAGL